MGGGGQEVWGRVVTLFCVYIRLGMLYKMVLLVVSELESLRPD